jgi:hypothetical protein
MNRPSLPTILLGISRIWILGSGLAVLGSTMYYDVGRVLGYSESDFDPFPNPFWPLRVALQLAVSSALIAAALRPRQRRIRFVAIFIIACGLIAWLWALRFQAHVDMVRWPQFAAATAALYGIPMTLAILILASRRRMGSSETDSTVVT